MSAVEPWGYLLPLRDGPAPLELRQDAATAGTAPSCTLLVDAATSGLPAGAPPPLLFSLRRDAASGSPVLRSAADAVWVDDQQVPRGSKLTLQHGARIAFQPGVPTYVYVDRKESDKFRAPRDVLDEYLVGHCLGGGGFGNVYALFHKKQGYSPRALKIVESRNQDVTEYVKRESRILLKLKHPFVIETFSIGELGHQHFILMEYVAGGDLEQFLHVHGRHIAENEIKLLFFQLALAVEYLHGQGICHRDLKPSNILLQQCHPNTLIKVTDFGLAKVKNYDSTLKSWAGTKQYLAPEIVREEKSYTNAVDVWSMGVILFYSFTGTFPFKNIYQELLHGHVVKYIPELWYGVSEEGKVLVRRMLTPRASARISVSEVLEDPWLRDDALRRALARLPGLQNYIHSRAWDGGQEPWGYLLPLREGPPTIELRMSSTTVGTGESNAPQLDATTLELASDTPPQNLFAVIRGRSAEETVLRSESDFVFVNNKQITQSKEEILPHGARISFVRKKDIYIFVNVKESDSFNIPSDVLENHFVVPLLSGGKFGSASTLFDKEKNYQRKFMMIIESTTEFKIILTLKFPCIIKILDVSEMNKKMYVIMEYMEGGNLEQLVNDKGPFSEKHVKLIFFQVALALRYLHERNLCLCNWKPSNFLLQRRHPHTLIKISAFDITKDGSFSDVETFAGSSKYLAPELFSTRTITMSADMWSMGILLYYIVNCTFPAETYIDILKREGVLKWGEEIEWIGLYTQARLLVNSMLILQADARVTINQVIEDPWLRDKAIREDVFRLTGIQYSLTSSSGN